MNWKIIVAVVIALLISKKVHASDWHVVEVDSLFIDYKNYKMVNPNSRNMLIYPEAPKEGLNLGLNLDIMRYFHWDNSVESLTTDGQYRSIGLETRLGLRLTDYVDVGLWHHSQHLLDRSHDYMDKFPSEDAVYLKFYLIQQHPKEGLF